MASVKELQTKDGKQFFQISVSRGYGKAPYKKRWYPEPLWSKRTVERELKKVTAEFERACAAGEIENRAQKKEREKAEAAEAAALKSFKDYALGVYMASKEQSFSENSKSSYKMFLERHIFPTFGELLLVDITTAQINKFLLDFKAKGYSQATVTKLFNIMRGVFQMAFADDSIQSNPMLKAVKPKASKDEKAQAQDASEKALTVEQLRYVLSCVAQEPLKWQAYINLAADSGARRGELCAARWSDIDWKSGTITIKRNLQYTSSAGVYQTSPKNGKARTVDVGPETLALLRQLREEQAASCISQWVFTQDGTAEPMFPQSPTKYFKKFGERYGVKDFHPHKLRHSSASIAITSGADVVSVSERLGHSDTAVTLRMYAHANEESIRRAGQTVRDALKAQNE